MIITKKREVAESYLNYLQREIELISSNLGERREISQLHLGGGTPTYYSSSQLSRLFEEITRHFSFTREAELAIEIDPSVTSEEQIKTLAKLGFYRYSMGIQDFDREVQEAVNRLQSFEETRRLIELCREEGAKSVNVDLIAGLPKQSVEKFKRTLELVLELSPDRLAIYSFAYVPWLKGHQKKLAERELPGPKMRFQLHWLAREILEGAGYIEIGMDHYAKPEDPLSRAQKKGMLRRNFMGYTVIPAPDWIGFGTSAIGYVSGGFFQNTKKLSVYREKLSKGMLPIERGIILNEDDQIRAEIIEEIMCNLQLDFAKIEDKWKIEFKKYFSSELKTLEQLRREGLVELKENYLRATPLGKLLIRKVAASFDRYLREKARNSKISRLPAL